jgi:hypothetical protein
LAAAAAATDGGNFSGAFFLWLMKCIDDDELMKLIAGWENG